VRVIARFHRDQVQLVVRDRGPGIPDEYLDKVFERYVQAPGGPAGRQGTGLGLAIAREVAVLHGGSISAWNRGHGGCAFGVWLPLTEQPARAEENDPHRTSG
jgi:signal transduction histidine kinase